jgi:hypothetical protein
MHGLLLALSWVGRGAWDSALVYLDRTAPAEGDSIASLRPYGLSTLGFWLGAIDVQEAVARRTAAAQAVRGAAGRAELAWLDGVLAAGRRNAGELAQARARLRASGGRGTESLDRSLGAFDAALRGDIRQAGEAMADLEWEQAALAAPDFADHPLVMPLNRLAGARWLAATGDADESLRLLRWVDGPYLIHPSTIYGLMLLGLADLERGRIEERLGRAELAASYYERFLRRYDRPVILHLPLVEEARNRLRKLTAAGALAS